MYEYCMMEYIEDMQDRYNTYDFGNSEFHKGQVNGFMKAFTILDFLLVENNYLEENSGKIIPEKSVDILTRKKIEYFRKELKLDYLDNDKNDKLLIRITKEFIVKMQELYNSLVNKKNQFSDGEKFAYYDFLDTLKINLEAFSLSDKFDGFDIRIPPLSLDKKI